MPLIGTHLIDPKVDATMATYNGLDSLLTFEVEENTRYFESDPNAKLIYDFELGLQAPALEMMMRGFRVDPKHRADATRDIRAKLDSTLQVLNTLSGAIWDRDLNPNSTKSLKSFFYDHMGIKPITKWVDGELTTPMNRETLEELEAYFFAQPIASTVLFARDLIKSLQVLETEIDPDMRWRCSYNIGGTKTGRWSSSKSPVGTGNNFQNISEELRRVFIPDPGWKLYGIDLEQAESREVGWFCGTVLGDWTYLDMIERGDLHTQVARMCWPELPWNGDIKHDRTIADRKFYRHFSYRDATKRLGHGSNYLGKPSTMSAHTKIPLRIVERFQENYFTELDCIVQMHHWIATTLQTKRFLINAFGRRRDFFDRPESDETIRQAVAYMFQSATGDRLNLGLWRLWHYMGDRIQILSQLHDAVYFQGREADEKSIIPEALEMMKVKLIHTNATECREFTIPGEAVGGFNWAHRYKLDESGKLIEWNKHGLDKIRLN